MDWNYREYAAVRTGNRGSRTAVCALFDAAARPIDVAPVRFALLLLLSLFYIPAAIDLNKYRANAWLALGSRFGWFRLLFDAIARVPFIRLV